MPDQFERFSQQIQGRFIDDLGFGDTLDVYVPTVSDSLSEGKEESYPSSPTATVDAEWETPDGDATRDEGGGSAEYDIRLRVGASDPIDWRGYEASGQAPIVVQLLPTGVWYEIETRAEEPNGLLELEGVETGDPT